MAFSGWSTTAANNTNAATGVNFDEGQAPSTINDSGRELMAQLKSAVVDLTSTQTLTNKTLTSPVINSPTGDVVTLTGTQTLTNKTLTAPAISQVVFPATQVPSADANTLDDYEEGTWTPSLGGNTTYSFQVGHYTKIGRMVFLTCDFQVLLIGTGSTTVISGLPFVVGTQSAGGVGSFGAAATNVVSVYANVIASTSSIQILSQTAASGNNAANAFFGSGTSIQFSAIYRV